MKIVQILGAEEGPYPQSGLALIEGVNYEFILLYRHRLIVSRDHSYKILTRIVLNDETTF